MLDNQMKLNCLAIAQFTAPIDTGNLRYNAIKMFPIPNGFRIVYLNSIAHYIPDLEEGTKNFSGHKGFISKGSYGAIKAYIESVENGSPDNVSNTHKILARDAADNPARQARMLRSNRMIMEVS